jgi:hypothetical protein
MAHTLGASTMPASAQAPPAARPQRCRTTPGAPRHAPRRTFSRSGFLGAPGVSVPAHHHGCARRPAGSRHTVSAVAAPAAPPSAAVFPRGASWEVHKCVGRAPVAVSGGTGPSRGACAVADAPVQSPTRGHGAPPARWHFLTPHHLPCAPPRFGGTCVGSSERIRNAAKLMTELPSAHKCVVVSAMGTPGKGIPKARGVACTQRGRQLQALGSAARSTQAGVAVLGAGSRRLAKRVAPLLYPQVTDMLLNMIAKAETHDEAYNLEARVRPAVLSASPQQCLTFHHTSPHSCATCTRSTLPQRATF